MTTILQAYDTVVGIVQTAWDGDSITSSLPLEYDDAKDDTPGESPAGSTHSGAFGRVTIRTISSPQSTQGTRRWLTTALLTVQVFTPIGDGHTLEHTIIPIVLGAIRAHVGGLAGVWFFDAAPQEIGVSGVHFQTNISASFRYQEVA